MIKGLGRSHLVTLAGIAALMPSCGGGPPSAASPGTTPTPAPTPTASAAASCPMGSPDSQCDRHFSRLLAQVEGAIDLLIQQKPQLFDLTVERSPGTGTYRVLDSDGYLDGVVGNLRTAGLCAARDPDNAFEQTIRVKSSNDFSEDFDVVLDSGYVRRGEGAYRQTCTPAAFPIERGRDDPPIGSGCGRPFPPPIASMNCRQHLGGIEYYTVDSTPIVGPDIAYCAAAGFADGRARCAVRNEGWPDRRACEDWRVGNALDTGLPGPTWRKEDGSFCTGPLSGCEHSATNPYQLRSYTGGTYTVCAQTGSCCTVVIVR